MNKLIMVVMAVAAVLVIGIPARMIGKSIFHAGTLEKSKWKRDLGAAVYAHSFRLTIAIVALFVFVVPKYVFGVDLF